MSAFAKIFMGLALVVGSAMLARAADDDMRTWTDSTGKHELKAKFDSLDGGEVVLIRENGKKMKIALDKLSKDDQQYVADQSTDNPFEAVDDDADEPSPDAGRGVVAGGPRTWKPDWSKSQVVASINSESQWNVKLPTATEPGGRAKSAPLRPKRDFFDKISGLAISHDAKTAVIGYTLTRPGVHQETSNCVVMCDLSTGRATAMAEEVGEPMIPLALHDDGRQILMCRNVFGFGNLDRLEIWTIQGKKIKRTLQCVPYSDLKGDEHDVFWAAFIGADKLATCSRSGRIAIWDFAKGQPICHLETCDRTRPALSADRKYIAFATGDSIGVFDVDKKEVVAMQKAPHKLQWPQVAFSPSGRKIVCTAFDRVLVWDTESGNLEKDFGVSGISVNGVVDFPDDDYILVNNQYLIELPNQLKLWSYSGAEAVRTVGGTSFLAIPGDDQGGLLLAAKLPHPMAVDLLKKAIQQPDLFVFHKGTPVKLDVSGIPDEAKKAAIQESLTKKLAALNCELKDDANVQVVALVEGPTARKVSYMHGGSYDVQEYRTKVKFVYDGQSLWESSTTNIPPIIQLKRDDNIESYLRRASSSPTYEFYDHVVLPEFLQKPSDQKDSGGQQTLGASQLSRQGL